MGTHPPFPGSHNGGVFKSSHLSTIVLFFIIQVVLGLSLWHMGSIVAAHRLSYPTVCGILVPQSGLELESAASEGSNHWTTRKVARWWFLTSFEVRGSSKSAKSFGSYAQRNTNVHMYVYKIIREIQKKILYSEIDFWRTFIFNHIYFHNFKL